MGNQDLYLPKLSFEYPYLDEGFHNENWDYGGDAVISNNNGIFLTQNLPSRRGWLWSIEHLPKESWEVSVDFTVGQGKPGLVGDGFAIWATKERVTSGPVFGNRDFFTGLGLFFDTYANSKEKLSFPIVAGMIGDGKTGYDFSSDGLKHSIGHCDKLFYRNQPTPSTARITYIRSKLLRVEIKVGNQDFVNCFSQNNVELPDDIYLGLSALTGDLSDAHIVHRVSTSRLDEKSTETRYLNPSTSSNFQSTNKSFFPSLIKLAIVGGVLFGAYKGYQIYTAKSNKRF